MSWLPALTAVLVTVAVLGVLFGREMRGRFPPLERSVHHDRVLLAGAATVCVLLVPAFLSGVRVVWPASVAAAVLVALFAWRDREALRWSLLPVRVVAVVLVLLVVARWLGQHVLATGLADAAGHGEGFSSYLRLATVGALGANGIDNLPAYLALEPIADGSPARLMALLIGVNTGPLLTPWASLATLLWHERCRSAGVSVSWWAFAARGLVVVPLLLVACTAALSWTAR